MPRISELKPNYMAADIGLLITGQLKRKRVSVTEMSKKLGITRQALSYKLDHGSFSYKDLIILFHELELTDEEILRYITY